MLTAKSAKDFATARSRAFRDFIINLITRRPNRLLSFMEVQKSLNLQMTVDRGLQEIELDNIVGSVGKSHEFTRRFLPKQEDSEYRWRQIDELFYERGFPPIDVYKVGDVYFVNDGNHRVSVNRTHNVPMIEAYVREYQTSVDIDRYDTLKSLRQKVERKDDVECLETACQPAAV